MRLAELRTTDGRTLVLHPRLAIVEADETTRGSVLEALSGALSGGSPAAGFFEVHGIVLDLDRATLRLLEVDPQLPARPRPRRHPRGGVRAVRRSPPSRRRRRDEAARARRRAQAASPRRARSRHRGAGRSAGSDDRARRRRRHGSTKPSTSSTPRSRRAKRPSALSTPWPTRTTTPLIEAEDAVVIDVEAVEVVEGEVGDDTDDVEVAVEDEVEDVGDPWEAEREARAQDLAAADASASSQPGAKSSSRPVPRTPPGSNAEDRAALEAAHEATLDADDRPASASEAAPRAADSTKRSRPSGRCSIGSGSIRIPTSCCARRWVQPIRAPSCDSRSRAPSSMEAEAALSAARSRAEAVPAPPPPRPVAAKPNPEPKPTPPTAVAIPAVAPEPPAAKPSVAPVGDGAARLAAARAREDDAARRGHGAAPTATSQTSPSPRPRRS